MKVAERYITLKKTHEHIDKAYDDVVIFDNLLLLTERVMNLVLDCVFVSRIGERREILPRAEDPGYVENESEVVSSVSSFPCAGSVHQASDGRYHCVARNKYSRVGAMSTILLQVVPRDPFRVPEDRRGQHDSSLQQKAERGCQI